MKTLNWNFDQLKAQLSSRKEIRAWIVTEEHIHRRERYFMSECGRLVTDQDRNVRGHTITLRLFVNLPNPKRQGEITKKLFPSLPLQSQIDQAIDAAILTDHQAWDLPKEVPSRIPNRLTTDPSMAEDLDQVMTNLTKKIEKTVNEKRISQFNSAELFLSIHHLELHLSNGLNHRSSQSRIYIETAFSFTKSKTPGETHSDEYMNTQWAVHTNQLPIEKIFEEAADRAAHSLEVTKPTTGKYSVIINAEVLSTLLNGYLTHLFASNSYNGLPFIKLGGDFIPNSNGDFLTITLDPTLDYGANTAALSDHGLLQTPLKLVEQNRVIATATDKQYGDYLANPPTTVRGNLVIEPGSMTFEELTQESSQVIEILQFSGLFADPNSGTFSSEIRLARLFDNNTGNVSYLKGGSLSGSIAENFRGLKLSKTCSVRSHFSTDKPVGEGYYGPEFALLRNVSIVG